MANQIDNDAKIIGEQNAGFGQNNVVTDSDGRIYAGQVNDSNYLEIHYSDDGGTNWTQDHTTDEEVGDGYFSLCLSENDDLFVCFVTGSETSWNVRVKKRAESDGTWSEVYNESSTSYNSGDKPRALITYNRNINRLHVFWFEHPDNVYIRNDSSDDYGDTWNGILSKTVLGLTTRYDFTLLGLDTDPSNGDVYILWFLKYLINSTYVHHSRFNSTGSYQDREDLTAYSAYGGGLAIDSSGNIYDLVYESDWDLILYKNGSSITVFSTGSDDLKRGMFDIGIDGQDNVYCFYVKESDGKTYYKKYYDGSLGDETVVATGVRIGCEQHALGESTLLNLVYFGS